MEDFEIEKKLYALLRRMTDDYTSKDVAFLKQQLNNYLPFKVTVEDWSESFEEDSRSAEGSPEVSVHTVASFEDLEHVFKTLPDESKISVVEKDTDRKMYVISRELLRCLERSKADGDF